MTPGLGSLQVGPYRATLESVPTPIYANGNVTIIALLRSPSGDVPEEVSLRITAPNGSALVIPVNLDERAIGSVTFFAGEVGEHVARLAAFDEGVGFANETLFFVYPDAPYRLWPADAIQADPPVGRPYRVAVAIVDHVSEEPALDLQDVSVRIEHWSDDLRELRSSVDLPLGHEGLGTWSVNHTFAQKGIHRLEFRSASGGFDFGDLPPMDLFARERVNPAEANATPAAPMVGLLLAIATLALVRRRE